MATESNKFSFVGKVSNDQTETFSPVRDFLSVLNLNSPTLSEFHGELLFLLTLA